MRYEIQSFDYADGTIHWCVYDNKEKYHIHSDKTLQQQKVAPECCQKICNALNYEEENKKT
jgi:hypothetical protein